MTSDVAWTDQSHLLHPGDRGYLYRVLGADGYVVYVGKTTMPVAVRFQHHHSARVIWLGEATKLEVLEVPRSELAALEDAEIHKWHPIYNRYCYLCSTRNFIKDRPGLYRKWQAANRTREVLMTEGICQSVRTRDGLPCQTSAVWAVQAGANEQRCCAIHLSHACNFMYESEGRKGAALTVTPIYHYGRTRHRGEVSTVR